jgi:hypothetical protein
MLNPLYAFICQQKNNNVIVGNTIKQKGICNAKYPKEEHITNSLFMRQIQKFQHIIEIIQQVHCLTQN